jgi:hypothetical protein
MHLFHFLLNKCRDKPKLVPVCNFKHLLFNYFLGLATYNHLFVLLTVGVEGCFCM